MGCSTAAKWDESLDKSWACPAHRTLSVSRGLWGSGRGSAGPDAQLLHDDWMTCLRLNPFLIDSEMSESAILWCKHPSESFSVVILFFWVEPETFLILLATFSSLKTTSDKSTLNFLCVFCSCLCLKTDFYHSAVSVPTEQRVLLIPSTVTKRSQADTLRTSLAPVQASEQSAHNGR